MTCKCNGQCCQNPTFTRDEFDFVKAKYEVKDSPQIIDLGIDYVVIDGPCLFLGKDWCSIYPDRPKLCREYGETIPCNYGGFND